MKGIKELKELLNALEIVAGVAGSVMKDGKVGVDDLSHLVALGVQFQALADGFSDLDEAIAEAKDLDQMEVIELIKEVYEIVQKFEQAKKA